MSGANELEVLKEKLRKFALERDWDQYHSPKNLSMALVVAEVAELLEHFQWLTEEQSAKLPPEKLAEVEQELADILIYLIRVADKLDRKRKRGRERELESSRIAAGLVVAYSRSLRATTPEICTIVPES